MEKVAELFPVSPALFQWIRDIRRHIHANPELSCQERNTAAYIQEKLKEKGIASSGGIAKTGVLADLPARSENRRGVALRADMDALPVPEETGLDYSSKNQGVMHACGHDGHVAMLLGAAALLMEKRLPAPVRLLFQPAEENGNGALAMVAENALENIGAVFAGHIDTHFEPGLIMIDNGIICAWADPFTIVIHGRSGHAARPHESVDALVAAANLVMSAQTLVSRGVDPNRAAVVTIGMFQAGFAQNIIAHEALLQGTVRSTHMETREKTISGLKRVVESIGTMHGVETSIVFNDSIPAVRNHVESAAIAKTAAGSTYGVRKIIEQTAPSLGAEDFAFYQDIVPGCMVRFGASPRHPAGVSHSRTFDFDEEVLAIGAGWYANVAWTWLKQRYGTESEYNT